MQATLSSSFEYKPYQSHLIIPGKKMHKRKYQYEAFIWMAPALVLLLIFAFYPPVRALIDSFFDVDRFNNVKFVFFDNYVEMFNDSMFIESLKNTALFTVVGLITGNIMTILLAELLYHFKNNTISGVFRIIFIIPMLVPGIVTILMWQNVIFGSEGLVNTIIAAFGGTKSAFYYDYANDWVVRLSIIFTGFPWLGGTAFLIYLAGLQNIPSSVNEACLLDNCGPFKRVLKIDLPLVGSQLKYFLITGIIGGIQAFDLQLIVIGAEKKSSDVLGYYLYQHAMGFGYNYPRPQYASAVGMFIFIITLILTIINNSIKRREKV